jgi:hypothetical protein
MTIQTEEEVARIEDLMRIAPMHEKSCLIRTRLCALLTLIKISANANTASCKS